MNVADLVESYLHHCFLMKVAGLVESYLHHCFLMKVADLVESYLHHCFMKWVDTHMCPSHMVPRKWIGAVRLELRPRAFPTLGPSGLLVCLCLHCEYPHKLCLMFCLSRLAARHVIQTCIGRWREPSVLLRMLLHST